MYLSLDRSTAGHRPRTTGLTTRYNHTLGVDGEGGRESTKRGEQLHTRADTAACQHRTVAFRNSSGRASTPTCTRARRGPPPLVSTAQSPFATLLLSKLAARDLLPLNQRPLRLSHALSSRCHGTASMLTLPHQTAQPLCTRPICVKALSALASTRGRSGLYCKRHGATGGAIVPERE